MVPLILFTFITTIGFGVVSSKYPSIRNILFSTISLILIIIAAFRCGNSVADYSTYVKFYNDYKNVGAEISFQYISFFVKSILFNNPIFLFIIYAIIGVSLKMRAIKQLSSFWFLSTLIYLSNFYLLHELAQIRAGVAAGFVLLCIKPLYERNLKKFIIFTLFAFLFHYSAIVISLLWFINPKRLSPTIWIGLLLISYVFYFLNISPISISAELIPIEAIQRKITYYKLLAAESKTNIFNVMQLFKFLVIFLTLWKFPLIVKCNRYSYLILKMYIISACILPLFAKSIPAFSFRVSELFSIVEIILIPCFFYINRNKVFSYIIIVTIAFSLMLFSIFYTKLVF